MKLKQKVTIFYLPINVHRNWILFRINLCFMKVLCCISMPPFSKYSSQCTMRIHIIYLYLNTNVCCIHLMLHRFSWGAISLTCLIYNPLALNNFGKHVYKREIASRVMYMYCCDESSDINVVIVLSCKSHLFFDFLVRLNTQTNINVVRKARRKVVYLNGI